MKRKIPLREAERVAGYWIERLAPHCKRINIAGSIRRKCETVGDIEIVAVPKLLPFETFAEDIRTARIVACKGFRNFSKAKYLQFIDKWYNVQIDLFLATPETWGVIFAIRTGSAEFSHGLMNQANRFGLTSYKGRLTQQSNVIRDKSGKPKAMGLSAPLETPEETDVFRALKIQYVEPPMRHGFSDIHVLSKVEGKPL